MRRLIGFNWVAACALGVAVGCSSSNTDDDSVALGGGGTSNSDPWATSGGSSSSSGGTGGMTGVGDLVGASACKRVDLLIAVDGSQSMTEELQAMRRVIFPAFAERLGSIGQGLEDYRVGTIDACPMPSNLHSRGQSMECNFASGQPWIANTDPDMVGEFSCVGDILLSDQECSGDNDDEQPASAAAAALETNPDFHREDALTIVVAITDEDEQPTGSAQSAEEVYTRLVKTVAGDPRRMVFLGIGGSRDCRGTYGSAEEARRLNRVTELFDNHGRGVFWDLCQGRLEDGLEEAFQVIERACEDLCLLDNTCGGQTPPDPPDPNDPCLLDMSCGEGGVIPPDDEPTPFCEEFPDDPSCDLG